MLPIRCLTPLKLEALEAENEWVLTAPLVWSCWPEDVVIPERFVTDLASIPRALQFALNVTGKSRRAAVLHDYLYCTQQVSRKTADEALRLALVAEGMSAAAARLYWLGVRSGGWQAWNKRERRGGGLQQDDFA